MTRQMTGAEMVIQALADQGVRTMLEQSGAPPEAVLQTIDYLITSQSVMLATNQLMIAIGVAFIVAASVIWLAPKPTRVVEPGAGALLLGSETHKVLTHTRIPVLVHRHT